MDVQAQFLHTYLDKNGSMFDFSIAFFIVSPANQAIAAIYNFR